MKRFLQEWSLEIRAIYANPGSSAPSCGACPAIAVGLGDAMRDAKRSDGRERPPDGRDGARRKRLGGKPHLEKAVPTNFTILYTSSLVV